MSNFTKYQIERPTTISAKAALDRIVMILGKRNYFIVSKSPIRVEFDDTPGRSFWRRGTSPINQLENGVFEIITLDNAVTVKLTYNIPLIRRIFAVFIVIVFAVLVDYRAFFLLVIVFSLIIAEVVIATDTCKKILQDVVDENAGI